VKAMVLAAGLGTRLRPLTDDRPKALVKIAGRTLLEITLERLQQFGIREVIINVHHFAGMMVDYLRAHDDFGMQIEISREDDLLLDTGGGLKKAARFFEGDTEPFILHNVDIISTIDLHAMVRVHTESRALSTLAVKDRKTSRYLLFDESGQLCGRRAGTDGFPEIVRPSEHLEALAFSGVHVISPRLLNMLTEDGVFSIINSYLRLSGAGERILGFRTDDFYWRDLGKPPSLVEAAQDLKNGLW
jgi:mannose-1-phosphate guanylyltransferase